MDLGLGGATVVVAGGSRGMGRATAELLAAEGCRVAVLARSEPDLRDAEEGLRAKGAPDVLALRADLLVAADVEAAFATVGRRWGGRVSPRHGELRGGERPGPHRPARGGRPGGRAAMLPARRLHGRRDHPGRRGDGLLLGAIGRNYGFTVWVNLGDVPLLKFASPP